MMERISVSTNLEWSSLGLVVEKLAFSNITCMTGPDLHQHHEWQVIAKRTVSKEIVCECPNLVKLPKEVGICTEVNWDNAAMPTHERGHKSSCCATQLL